jgi:glycerophosphoryl diester phosphodiesterase
VEARFARFQAALSVVAAKPPRPLVIGHRGFPSRHPDNSLAGIAAALEVGADGVEVDVRRCAEGAWVCHHDLRRGGRPVRSWLLSALAAEGVPSLARAVALLPTRAWLFVEVKPLPMAEMEPGLAELVRLLGPRAARTLVISSSPAVLEAVGGALPAVGRSWVVARIPPGPPLPGVAISPHHTLLEQLAGMGVPLHPWTVNRVERMREVAGLGVASLTTNRPDLAVEVFSG